MEEGFVTFAVAVVGVQSASMVRTAGVTKKLTGAPYPAGTCVVAVSEEQEVAAGPESVTVAVSVVFPPAPVQVMVYDVVASGVTVIVPDVALEVVQVAVQAVVFVEDQVRTALLPAVMVEGVAVREAVGVWEPPPSPTPGRFFISERMRVTTEVHSERGRPPGRP